MGRPISLGYLAGSPSSVEILQWSATSDSNPLGEDIADAHWHYMAPVTVKCRLRINEADLRGSSQLHSSDELRLVMTWKASATGLQGGQTVRDVCGGDLKVEAHLPGPLLGGRLDFEVAVVLGRLKERGRSSLAAHRPGSILWHGGHRFALEGDSSRFPAEAVSFGALGIQRAGVAWSLDIDTSNPDAPALSRVRLLINTDHQVYRRLTEAPDSPEAEVTKQMLAYDVARQFVCAALTDDDFTGGSYPDASIGQALQARLLNYFGSEGNDVHSLRQRYREQPAEIDALLQEHFAL